MRPEEADFVRPIALVAVAGVGWNRAPIGRKLGIRGTSMLPQFKISAEVLQTLYALASSPSVPVRLSGSMIGTKSSPHHFLSLTIEDCRWNVKQSTRAVGDFVVALRQDKLVEEELESALNTLLQDLTTRCDDAPFEPLHLCKSLCSFTSLAGPARLRLHFTVLHPSVSLQFTPINPLKVLSTPLSVQLVKDTRRPTRFLSGYLTQDRSKRLVPLLYSDPNARKCQMVGVWATGVPRSGQETEKLQQFPFLHPLVWAAALRYILTTTIRSRLSPAPETHSFLFVYFDPTPRFYEVGTCVRFM